MLDAAHRLVERTFALLNQFPAFAYATTSAPTSTLAVCADFVGGRYKGLAAA